MNTSSAAVAKAHAAEARGLELESKIAESEEERRRLVADCDGASLQTNKVQSQMGWFAVRINRIQ